VFRPEKEVIVPDVDEGDPLAAARQSIQLLRDKVDFLRDEAKKAREKSRKARRELARYGNIHYALERLLSAIEAYPDMLDPLAASPTVEEELRRRELRRAVSEAYGVM
jgi:hypothetical protein